MLLTAAQSLALLSIPQIGNATFFKIGDYVSQLSTPPEPINYNPQVNPAFLPISNEYLLRTLNNMGIKKGTYNQTNGSPSTKRGKSSIMAEDLYPAIERAQQLINSSLEMGVQVVSYYQPDYPNRIKFLNGDHLGSSTKQLSPPVLFYRGNINLLNQDCITITGSRFALPSSIKASRFISNGFARYGFVIVSGLNIGCDYAIIEGTINNPNAQNIIVLGNGLDHVYPQKHYQIVNQVLQKGGLVISERHIGEQISPTNLERANTFQACCSLATIVVQSHLQEECIRTATIAQQQKHPVFVLKYSDPVVNQDDLLQGNHYLVSAKKASYIHAYSNSMQMENEFQRVIEKVKQNFR